MSDADRAKWNARYAGGAGRDAPSSVITALDAELPRTGRALDVAGGGGRHAVWLAQRGLDVTLVDISAEGLGVARGRAAAAGVAIETVEADLETTPLPAGPFDLIVSFHYLNRALFAQFPDRLAPGGVLVYAQPTARNLERHAKPPRPFLLAEGELATLVTGLDPVSCTEAWHSNDRHEALLIARKRLPS